MYLFYYVFSILATIYFVIKSFVSLAIISSSFVGTTQTSTFEFGADILPSSLNSWFFSSSISTPKHFKFSHILLLALYWFSPIPAVNTIVSSPPSETMY